ncbi:MAG: cation-translocating P-type ATPase [Burkholderiales bacterium]
MNPQGLTSADAAERLAAEGPNCLPARASRGMAAIAAEVVREPMLLLLFAAAGLYLALGDLHEALVLAASIVVVVAITVLQERKAERALEALRDLSSPRALVVRDGETTRIAGADVVRGDLVILGEGDRVPADARLVQGAGLTLDESLLTGESLAVEKRGGDAVFSGTLVVKGQARAEVFATGPRSELGRIGLSLATLESGKTALELETARIVKLVAAVAVALSLAMAAAHFVLRGDWIASLLAGLTLAMAILPEEFPVILAVFLALGAWRISRRGVLTRRMPAIEMLGAATVLCVDKTGTLTENRMSVVDTTRSVVDVAALACALDPHDPMDRAIVAAASPLIVELRKTSTLERGYPLTDRFLAVCNAWRVPAGRLRVAIKGAPETVLALCGNAGAIDAVQEAAARGMRLLAVAEADWDSSPLDDPAGYPYRFAGFVKLADPLRASVPAAVAQCRGAGIRVVMITGDHPGTALRIAGDAGIDTGSGALTGRDLAAMDDAALAQAVRRMNVFARVRPEHKLRLVQAYRAAGEVVAMTGDGVNDAPALKAAHIGIAMGRRGTDVAREAAHLVLLEDDFGSIVDTVRLGRRIYDNIRNAMRYIISVHVPTAGMSFLPLVLGGPLFLFPVHVVFLEFVIDPACTLVYEAEKTDARVMQRPPRDPREPLFNLDMLLVSIALGLTILLAVLAVYAWALQARYTAGETRALAFAAIVAANVALIFVTRSRSRGALAMLREPNPALWWISAGALGALVAAIYVAPVAAVFRFAPIGLAELAIAAVAGVAGVVWYELWKFLRPPGRG